jgi:raffinose/stachyose/melibiose transport system permease protein
MKFARWLGFIMMTLISMLIIIPLLLIILSSLKPPAEAAQLSLQLPSRWIWSNYHTVFIEGKLLRSLSNSFLITLGSVIIIIVAGTMTAFILARRPGRWFAFLYLLFIGGLIAPPSIIPTIKVMQFLHLSNQYVGLMLFYAATLFPFVILVITGFVKSVPREIDESAVIDGARGVLLFFRIILPLLLPSVTTATVFVFMLVWNDFQWPLFLLNDSAKWTIPLSVFNFVSKYGTQWQYVFADLLIAMVPVLILYLFAQRFIIEGMTAGAVKG